MLFRFFDIRQYADNLRSFGHGPALGQMHRTLIAQKRAAQAHIASFARTNRVFRGGGAIGVDEEFKRVRLEAQLWRRFVYDNRANRKLSSVPQLDCDRGWNCERRTQSPDPSHFKVPCARQSLQIPKPPSQQQSVPQEHRHNQARHPPSRNQPCKAKQQRDEKARAKSKRNPAVRARRRDGRRRHKWSFDHYFGTCTAASTSAIARSAVNPSRSASGLSRMR